MSDADTCRVAKSLAAQATSTWSGARRAAHRREAADYAVSLSACARRRDERDERRFLDSIAQPRGGGETTAIPIGRSGREPVQQFEGVARPLR
jgi:hypothetical protein